MSHDFKVLSEKLIPFETLKGKIQLLVIRREILIFCV